MANDQNANENILNNFAVISILSAFKKLRTIYIYIYIYIYKVNIYIYKVNLATVVKGDQKATFSIATTPKCWEGRFSFP